MKRLCPEESAQDVLKELLTVWDPLFSTELCIVNQARAWMRGEPSTNAFICGERSWTGLAQRLLRESPRGQQPVETVPYLYVAAYCERENDEFLLRGLLYEFKERDVIVQRLVAALPASLARDFLAISLNIQGFKRFVQTGPWWVFSQEDLMCADPLPRAETLFEKQRLRQLYPLRPMLTAFSARGVLEGNLMPELLSQEAKFQVIHVHLRRDEWSGQLKRLAEVAKQYDVDCSSSLEIGFVNQHDHIKLLSDEEGFRLLLQQCGDVKAKNRMVQQFLKGRLGPAHVRGMQLMFEEGAESWQKTYYGPLTSFLRVGYYQELCSGLVGASLTEWEFRFETPEIRKQLVDCIEAAGTDWTPARHNIYPRIFRSAVLTFLLVNQRLKTEAKTYLGRDVLQSVVKQLARQKRSEMEAEDTKKVLEMFLEKRMTQKGLLKRAWTEKSTELRSLCQAAGLKCKTEKERGRLDKKLLVRWWAQWLMYDSEGRVREFPLSW